MYAHNPTTTKNLQSLWISLKSTPKNDIYLYFFKLKF